MTVDLIAAPLPGDTTPGATAPVATEQGRRPSHRREKRWGWALFAVCAVGYLAVGYYLYLVIGYINPDASSRVGNAGYTIMSRHPHLGAIGFVWNPLPSLVEIPLLPLSRWWPAMKTVGFAGAVMSAGFMAGAVWQVRRIGLDCTVPRVARWLAVAAFALNPMVILYAGSGMSEAPFIFLLMWACRRLLQWMRTARVDDLTWAGVALGLAYLTRYEALVAGVAVTILVFGVSMLRRKRDGRGWKLGAALAVHDVVIVSFPLLGAFVLWALVGWLLDGALFAQFTSQYGNAAQVEAAGIVSADSAGYLPLLKSIAANIFGTEPLILVVAVVVVAYAIRMRTIQAAAPLAVFGSVLTFQSYAILSGSTFGWFRFFMGAVPLVVVSLMCCWRSPGARAPAKAAHWRRPAAWGALLMAAVLVTSVPVTWKSMLNPAIGKEEYGLRSAIWPEQYPKSDFWFYWFGEVSRNTVRWFDAQNLPEGSVLVDTFGLARMWLWSDNSKQFVVRSDYDFFAKLNDPSREGVRYILSPKPSGLGELDSINIRYPTFWNDGAGFATLVMTINGPNGGAQFRIYAVAESSEE